MTPLNVTTEILDLDEARRRLVKVKPHVEKVMALTREIRELRHEMESGPVPDPAEERKRKRKARAVEERFKAELKALNDLGAYLKDPETGLLDFYTWKDGDMVFLCWRHGEETIGWWHGLDEGFAGRKPIA